MPDEPRGSERLRALEERVAALEKELRAADEFLSFAAHELRTPATSIEGYAYLLDRSEERAPEMRQRCVDGIARNAARLVAIVTELLEIARARGGRLALARVRCDAAALAREAGADESRTEGPLIVEADARRLATILREMVLDARERARDRGPVRIEATARDGEAIVEVEDPAPAVGAEFLERAFQGARRTGGQNDDGAAPRGGLGLLLAREVIERLGGRTYARSGPAGNVLGLALPLAR